MENNLELLKKKYKCPLALTMELIGGKYKNLIIFHLKEGAMRSHQLQKLIEGISNRMFTSAVRELEENRLVKRTVYPVVPPKVEYELTDLGKSILPSIISLEEWGRSLKED